MGSVDETRALLRSAPCLKRGLRRSRAVLHVDARASRRKPLADIQSGLPNEGQIGVMRSNSFLLLPGDQAVTAVSAQTITTMLLNQYARAVSISWTFIRKPASPANRQYAPFREHDGCGNGARQREAHGAKAVRDQAGVRLVALVVARDPHLVGADVGQQDVVAAP